MLESLKRALLGLRSEPRGAKLGIGASRLYGRALNLEKQGRVQEAYTVLSEALELLPDTIEPEKGSTPVLLSTALVITVSYAELAEKLGKPEAARDAIEKAIRSSTPFESDSKVREYVDWLRGRL
jgi:tetratricopeptide (TPR) repeat protein